MQTATLMWRLRLILRVAPITKHIIIATAPSLGHASCAGLMNKLRSPAGGAVLDTDDIHPTMHHSASLIGFLTGNLAHLIGLIALSSMISLCQRGPYFDSIPGLLCRKIGSHDFMQGTVLGCESLIQHSWMIMVEMTD